MSTKPKEVGKYDNYWNKSGHNKTIIKISQAIESMPDILGLNYLISLLLCFLSCLDTSETT